MKNKNIIFIILCIVILILFSIYCMYHFRDRRTYYIDIRAENILNIEISNKEQNKRFERSNTISNIVDKILGVKRITQKESISDTPTNVNDYITINIKNTDDSFVVIYFYKKNQKCYIEQPYNGIYQISNDEYNSIYNYLKNEDIELNDFYTYYISSKYKEIKKLSKEYSINDAIKDNCFVVNHAKVYNENLYEEFMQNYKDKKNSFIRLVQPTVEGEVVIYDIKYDNKSNRIILVQDRTRDTCSSETDRTISLKEYKRIGLYQYKGNLYWVSYNGGLNDETFNSENILILTVIN